MRGYTGHKGIAGVLQTIINEVPRHNAYYELFAGSGIIGITLPACTVKNFNDLDCRVHGAYSHARADTINITNKPATDILQSLNCRAGTTDTFIFCDPPYLHSTRHSDKLYKHEMSDTDHIKFLSAVKSSPHRIAIIHPVCKLYEDALQSWRSVQLKIRYNTKTSIEKLYMNYPTQELQTYKFWGSDCWKRQAKKRRAIRHSHKSIIIPLPEFRHLSDPL